MAVENDTAAILIVDDREENLFALAALLEECEADVHRASSGNDALAQMLKKDFALVLLDVQMPIMDGFEVAELMRLNERTRYLPIIFVTAISKEQRYIFKGYETGAVDFLSKPIEAQILTSKVNVFLDLWHQKRKLIKVLAEKEKLEEKLRQQAEFDLLTGLPNRVLFHDRLLQAIHLSQRTNNPGALMFVDLDRFKWVNDNLGHEAGDQLLIQVAERLLACVRKTDTVARIGGDEFTVILQNVAPNSLAELIAKKIVKALARPFALEAGQGDISASIGITLFPKDSEDVGEIMQNADAAMYLAKESGRNGFKFFTQEMNNSADKRLALGDRLQAALEREEFVLHYLPKVDLYSGKITGMEALVRWEKSGEGTILPNNFIPLAEEKGLIVELDRWVLETACRQNQQWNSAGFKHLVLSVNISAKLFNDKDRLLSAIDEVLESTGLVPENLELEIKENVAMGAAETEQNILAAISERGVGVAIDDFGCGFTSFALLKGLAVNSIKIDRSFIKNLPQDSTDHAVTTAMVSVGKKLSLAVVAERVETSAQLELLKENGCMAMQGYYFSHPLPADECTKILSAGKILVS